MNLTTATQQTSTIGSESFKTKLAQIKKGLMGTVEFMGLFSGMRKAQGFICYPLPTGEAAQRIKVQSDTRIGFIDLTSGEVLMTPSIFSGAYAQHLHLIERIDQLNAEELLMLKTQILATASGKAGARGVYVDNAGAIEITMLKG